MNAYKLIPVAWATRLYNTAYHAGHHDTVEGCYTHVYPQDMDSHHEDVVQEWLADNPQPTEQQPAPEVAMLVEALSRCRHQASYSIGGEDALRVQLEKVRDIVSETLHALAAHRNQGGEA